MPPFLPRGSGVRGGLNGIRGRGRGRIDIHLRRLGPLADHIRHSIMGNHVENGQDPESVQNQNGQRQGRNGIHRRIMLRYIARVRENGQDRVELHLTSLRPLDIAFDEAPNGDSGQADQLETSQSEHVSVPDRMPHPGATPDESVVPQPDPLALPEVPREASSSDDFSSYSDDSSSSSDDSSSSNSSDDNN
ncbi:uncharacterized protein LOC110185554 [Drosophila serrata]|uniref:uncharacterized protein LOC110185554 n=1 Tax=Drosophila serrata TaxID=7274 RepID=UPI000A1D1999|nr:uncharacterized protein LOC110185554 [Drosophila serrata]